MVLIFLGVLFVFTILTFEFTPGPIAVTSNLVCVTALEKGDCRHMCQPMVDTLSI